MSLSYSGIAAGQVAASAQLKQVLDLLTGVMTDQIITMGKGATVAANGVTFTAATANSLGVGVAAPTDSYIQVSGTPMTAGTVQYGIKVTPTLSNAATSNQVGIYTLVTGGSGSYTTTNMQGVFIDTAVKGGSQTVTANIGLQIAAQNITCTNAYGIQIGAISGGATNNVDIVLGTAASKIVPGATSLSLRNNANNADNLIITDAGAATLRAGLTVTAGGFTLNGGNINLSNQAGTVNVIGPGTSITFSNTANNAVNLTITDAGLATFRNTVSITAGNLSFSATNTPGIIPGATNMSWRNNANNADNLLIIDAGAATFRTSVTTGAPNGGTAAPWRFGTVASVSPTAQNRTIELDVNGTRYFLTAKTTND